MQLVAVGIGGAGGRVAAALQRDSAERRTSYVTGACVLDTDTAAIEQLETIPEENRHPFGLEETAGAGTEGNRTAGVAAADANRLAVRRAIDSLTTSAVDAILLVAGVAGGTGSGATPPIAQALGEVYDRPIYTVGVLPAEATPAAASNTLRALRALDSVVDGQLLFDTNEWQTTGTPLDSQRDRLNTELATRIGELCAAGETVATQPVGQTVVDASDIIATLSGSEAGCITLGYASRAPSPSESESQPSLTDRIRNFVRGSQADDIDALTAIHTIETTVREATRGRLTIDCERNAASRGLVVFAGPSGWLHKEAIDAQRAWLQDELACRELRSGDAPCRGLSARPHFTVGCRPPAGRAGPVHKSSRRLHRLRDLVSTHHIRRHRVRVRSSALAPSRRVNSTPRESSACRRQPHRNGDLLQYTHNRRIGVE